MNVFQVLPPAASSMSGRFDTIFLTLTALCGFVAVAVALVVLVFGIRYRAATSVDRSDPPVRNTPLEVAWIVAPLLIFVAIFVWAASDYVDVRREPLGAMPVFVVARQWMWKLEHEGGRREVDELHVPVGRPVRLLMTSEDAIHSFFVPAFRVKQDAVPGRYTTLWFTATQPGEYRLFCAEYCGSRHATMGGRIVAMEPQDFSRWLESGDAATGIAARGFALFRRYGCSGCHDPRSTVHAPELAGLLGRTVHLADGRSIVADEAYIRDSILLPNRDVVAGFEPIMPSFAGQIAEDDLMAIMAYLRSKREG